MYNKKIKIGTFFSGIGSPEKALNKLKKEGYIKDYSLEFFSEIDKNTIKSYCAIHNINEKLNLGNIIDIHKKDLPYCDLWIGGFPCQDISCAGKMKGFDVKNSTRLSLGWEMIRLLKEVEVKPKFVIFENVECITSKKFKDTLNLFKKDLKDLGYTLYDKVISATDFGIPQIRKRYFLVAILDKNHKFEFPKSIINNLKMKDFLDKEVDEKYYLTNYDYKEINSIRKFNHKIRKEITYDVDVNKYLIGGRCGTDNYSRYNQTSRLFSDMGNCPTLTASNTKDACKIVVTNTNKMRIRTITPKEAWRLMGFDDSDYEKASKVCCETSLYHQAGNSIVVNVMYNLLKELFK